MSLISRPAIELDALRARIAGELHAPGDAGYDDARAAWNLAVDQRPALVASPRTAGDVAAVVRFAAEHGLRVAPQGTGHGASARSGLEDSVLVNFAHMRAVEIDARRRRARAEAGALWIDVVEPASAQGLAALAGSSPDVGVVGYALGGGIGWLARAFGLCSNSVTAIEVVTADGEQRRCDHEHDPELFWALRGGSGSYAVVTAIELQLIAVPEVYAGAMLWPWERAREVLHAWREWTADAPEAATTSARILQVPPAPDIPAPVRGRQFVVIDGAVLGTEPFARDVLAPLRALGPEIDLFAMAPPAALSRIHMDPEHPVPGATTHAMLEDLPAEAIDAMVAVAGPGSGSPLLAVELRHAGGALARVPAGAGALSRLQAPYVMFSVGALMAPEMAEPVAAHLARVDEAFAPWASARSYLNFADVPTDTSRVYPDDTFAALRAIKATYDPTDLVHANHPIAPSSRREG
ncbi:MAG TPA: FAD-binding oxidoreductase [Baekduia sp.]|nr:FAD-binding oxidoreductase [Baekduia sp.]